MFKHGPFVIVFLLVTGWLFLGLLPGLARTPVKDHPGRGEVSECAECHDRDSAPATHFDGGGKFRVARRKCYLCH